MGKTDLDLKYDYKSLVKKEIIYKSVLDSTQDAIRNRQKMEENVAMCLEDAKSRNDEFDIKRFSRELNDLKDSKEPATKEVNKCKQELLNIYEDEDKLLKKLEKTSFDISKLKYTARYLRDE